MTAQSPWPRALCFDWTQAHAERTAAELCAQQIETRPVWDLPTAIRSLPHQHVVVCSPPLQVAHELRANSPDVGVIMLHSRWNARERRRALSEVCDACLPKSCDPSELAAHVRAVARRSHAARTFPLAEVASGPIRVDLVGGHAFIGNREIFLQPLQLRILALLIQHAGRTVTHAELRERVFRTAQAVGSTNIARQVSALRAQFGPFRSALVTVPGGYRLDASLPSPHNLHPNAAL